MTFEDMRIKEICCVVRYTPKQKHWRASNRKNHIIALQISGKALHDMTYKHFTLGEGQVCFFNERDDYEVLVDEVGEALAIHFTTYEKIDTDSFVMDAPNLAELVRIFEKTEVRSRRFGTNDMMTLGLVYQFCGEICRLRERMYHSTSDRMTVALGHLNENFRREDCLREAVRLSGVTSRRFCDLFKTNFGLTPNRYIVLKRIGSAKELLQSGSFSVSDTAELCGYSDVYYFSRVFKAETGVTPSEWRKNNLL